MVGPKWLPFCGCARVGYKTSFTSGFECASAWEDSGSCQSVQASTSLNEIRKRKPIKTAPMPKDKFDQQREKLEKKKNRAPVFIGLNLTNATLIGDKCDALKKIHGACKQAVCKMLRNSFAALGYANKSLDCNRSKFTLRKLWKKYT